MKIVLNGADWHYPTAANDEPTVAALLASCGATGRVAVEVNGEIVPRSRHGEQRIAENDRIEIIRAIGGG